MFKAVRRQPGQSKPIKPARGIRRLFLGSNIKWLLKEHALKGEALRTSRPAHEQYSRLVSPWSLTSSACRARGARNQPLEVHLFLASLIGISVARAFHVFRTKKELRCFDPDPSWLSARSEVLLQRQEQELRRIEESIKKISSALGTGS